MNRLVLILNIDFFSIVHLLRAQGGGKKFLSPEEPITFIMNVIPKQF